MTTRLLIALLLSLSALFGADPRAFAQEKVVTVSRAVTTLMVEVTVSRHLGEKVLSSTPYTLGVTIGERASLRMGGDVPVPSMTFTAGSKDDPTAKPAPPMMSYAYRSIGTSIDVHATGVQDGQYRLTVTIDESSIYPPELAPATSKTTGAPAFRSFKSINPISLRDGQRLDYMMATDRVSGEIYRVGVKLAVEK